MLLTIVVRALLDAGGGEGAAGRVAGHGPTVVELGRSGPRTQVAPVPGGPPERPRPKPDPIPLARLVGAKVMARMDGAGATPDLLARARRGEVGGVIVFPDGSPDSAVARAIARLQRAARKGGGPGLLVATDQEGGEVKRFPAAPPSTPPSSMSGVRDARRQGSATGAYLARIGINVDLAPVLDVPSASGAFIASRTFGSGPERVASLATAFAVGLARSGVAATAKHFPGLGSATVNTDLSRSVITAPAASLRTQLGPFRRAVSAGIPLVMLSTAVYSGYDGSAPAALSSRVVTETLRGELGFEGVTITDDLETPAIASVTTPARAAVASARAGGDIALFARTAEASRVGYATLLAAARSGRLSRGQLRASYGRISALTSQLTP
jgi:beta-N-acetylhexosaminidase